MEDYLKGRRIRTVVKDEKSQLNEIFGSNNIGQLITRETYR